MLPDRAARAFPLLLLGLLAGLAVFLDRATDLPYFSPNAASRSADLSISRFVATGYGPDGKPLYTLKADAMQHFPSDDRSEFAVAQLVRTLPGEPPLQVDAAHARVTEGGDLVHFDKDVIMRRAAAPDLAAMTLRTSQLALDTVHGQANSAAAADLVTGDDHIHTTGFDYDHPNGRIKLRSKVSINYAPPKR